MAGLAGLAGPSNFYLDNHIEINGMDMPTMLGAVHEVISTSVVAAASMLFTLTNDAQAREITEILVAMWHLLDPALKRALRLASKALRQAVDVQVQHLEVTPDQATVEGMEQASRRWHMVTRLDVHVREPNPLTKAQLVVMFQYVNINAVRFHVFQVMNTLGTIGGPLGTDNPYVHYEDSSLALSHSGEFIMFNSLSTEESPRMGSLTAITVCELRTMVQRQLVGHTWHVQCLAISANDEIAASGCEGGSIRLWCIRTGACLRVFPNIDLQRTRSHPNNNIQCIVFSPEGSFITAGGNDGVLRQWPVEGSSTDPTRCFNWHRRQNARVHSVAYSSYEKIISGDSNGRIAVWNAVNGDRIQVLSAHFNRVFGLSLSADGCVLVSASHDRTLKRWGLNQGGNWECNLTLKGHEDGVTGVAVSRGGDLAVSGSMDGTVRVWDLQTGACKMISEEIKEVDVVALNGDCSTAISGGGGVVKVWRLYQ